MIEFVSAADEDQKKGAKDAAAEKAKEAKGQAKQEWDNAIHQVKAPGKIHRIERFAVGELPVHPQYINAGTVYFAELQEPLDFGTRAADAADGEFDRRDSGGRQRRGSAACDAPQLSDRSEGRRG